MLFRSAGLPSRPSSALLAALALLSKPPRFGGRRLNRPHPGRSKWRTLEFKEGARKHASRPPAFSPPLRSGPGRCAGRSLSPGALALPGPVLVRVLGRDPARGWPGAAVPHLLEPASTRSDPSWPVVHAARACTEGPQLASGKQNEIMGSQLRMSAPSWVSQLGPHFGQSRPAGGDPDGSGHAPWPWLC